MQHYQKPMTIFGFPIYVLLIAAMSTIGTMLFSFMLIGGLTAFAIFISVICFWVYVNRKLFRHDHHADLVLNKSFNRWGFQTKHICFTTGRKAP